MSAQSSVIHWLRRLEAGHEDGAQSLWERYFGRLVALADQLLQNAPRRTADEEDVALSAFASFCRGARAGRFEDVASRDSLWRLLVHITACKVHDHARRERAGKRGGGAGAAEEVDLDQVVGSEPSPEFAVQVADSYRQLLKVLPDETLRDVARWRMEGWAIQEIAEKLKCSVSTVNRALAAIRAVWGTKGQAEECG
jgi:DNA-directed RNA polymerase specialized sigma24 family protein